MVAVHLSRMPSGISLPGDAAARPRQRRRQIEAGIHVAVATTLDQCLLPGTLHTCFPAGGGGAQRGAFLKARGLKPGMPDHLIVHPGVTLWIELKVPKTGRASDAQKRRHAELRAAGHKVEICLSVDDVIAALDKHGIPHAVVLQNGVVFRNMLAAPSEETCALRTPTLAKAAE